MNYLTVSKLANYYGVHPQTIRRWCRNGNIVEHHRTIGNHRRLEEPTKQTIGYVRVSSADQKSDLKIQQQALAEKARLQNITIDYVPKVISRIRVICGKIGYLVVVFVYF